MIVREREVRGAACILVVLFHALDTAAVSPAWKYAAAALAYVRMPLFIALTGFLYGLKRDWQRMSWNGWLKRTRRLGPPFIAVTVVMLVTNAVRGWGIGKPWLALIYPINHLWYIQALGVILLIMFLLDRVFYFRNERLWLVAIVAAAFSALDVGSWIAEFSIGRALWLLPHFLFGAAFGATLKHGMPFRYRSALYLIAIIAGSFALFRLIPGNVPLRVNSIAGTAIGWAAVTVLFYNMPAAPLLARIGKYSFAIYLWHLTFAGLATLLVFRRLAITPEWEVAVRVVVGIVGPIGLVIACAKLLPKASIFVGVPRRDVTPSTSA